MRPWRQYGSVSSTAPGAYVVQSQDTRTTSDRWRAPRGRGRAFNSNGRHDEVWHGSNSQHNDYSNGRGGGFNRGGSSQQGNGGHNMLNRHHRHWLQSVKPLNPLKERFIVVSYNILGADSAFKHKHELYPHLPTFILDWDQRRSKLLQEIGLWSPDILCLQEVDRFDELQNEFGRRGYEGFFQARTGVSCDGCAIFWRKKRFTILHWENIEYRELDLRDNVAQVCVLQEGLYSWNIGNIKTCAGQPKDVNLKRHLKHFCCCQLKKKENSCVRGDEKYENEETGRKIVVCNTHTLFNPGRGDIKLGQVRVLLKKAHKLAKKWGSIPVVVGGDFNSTPQSPLYQFISSSELDVSLFNRRDISGQTSLEGSYSNGQTACFSRSLSETNQHRRDFQHPLASSWKEIDATCSKPVKLEEDVFDGGTSARETKDGDRKMNGLESKSGQGGKSRESCHYWSPEELKAATGSSKHTRARHRLNLKSAYRSIEGPTESRDSIGEPIFTSYHQKFRGTVDYIWFSEGLEPVRVLDILPVDIVERTRGLPTKKWGSDHLALACEFIIISDVIKESKALADNNEDNSD